MNSQTFRRISSTVLLAASLSACGTPGAIDTRMYGVPEEIVKVGDFPIAVRVVKVDTEPGVYDVQAGDGRSIAFTGLNEPIAAQARFRKGALMVMQAKMPPGSKITQLSEFAPLNTQYMFLRFSVAP